MGIFVSKSNECKIIYGPYSSSCINNIKQRPSLEADIYSASQETPLLWNLKIHYFVHNDLSLGLILSQMNPLRSILILFSHSHLGFPSGHVP
jgi:hypothetical protein